MSDDSKVILTRYLYNKTEVKQCLFLSLLEHNMDEALFWGYELYYSGFEEDTFQFLINIVEIIYLESCAFIVEYTNFIVENWKQNNSPILFGNFIATLCTKQYDLKDFCKLYLKIDGQQNHQRDKNRMIVDLDDEYIEKYKTKDINNPETVLKEKCIYHVKKEINRLFNISIPNYEELTKLYSQKWLYFASQTPIWKERIDKYNGLVNDEENKINFTNENDVQEFFNKYNYEPDEQTNETMEKMIGKRNIDYYTIKDFCKKYHFQIKTKRRK